MAENDPTPSSARIPGPELRLMDRRAFVGFPELKLAPGVVVVDFALQIPDVTFPLNVSGGASRYQKKKLDFGVLELTIDAEVIHRKVQQLASKLAELDELKLHFRPGYLEVQARLRGGERAPLTFKVAFDGDGEKLAVYCYDVRFYAFSTTPASRIPALIATALEGLGVLPDVERRGANGFSTRLLPAVVEQAAVARGYKMPTLDQARLAEAVVSSKGLRLRFSAGGLPPPNLPDEELLLTLEGARAFADAEELLAQGKLAEAREAYLRLGDAAEAHPFAVERLLTLLVADPQAHEFALDVAASLARRRERSATAVWAEAVVRERRGEFARASERYLALCALARRQQEEAGAFFAAEAAARAAREHAPQMAVKALHELLGLKPDHIPSLKALARASDQAKDRAGAIRAYRRLSALAREPADAAEAHVHLARLCSQTEDDVAGARLHCEAALRLAPDHPEALLLLGELCFRSDEHLRAVRALDRLRDVAMGRHEVDRVGRANLLAGRVWEFGLKQPENALLRYREAASLMPGEAEPLTCAGRVAESLGRIQEAVAAYQQAVELAGPAPREPELRRAAHEAHRALARLLKTKLGEPARGREHLEAALALDPTDTAALDELLPYFRAAGKAVELADACERAAVSIDEPRRRAALWAEAGDLYRGRLGQPERAERLLGQALEADPRNRLALEGMLAIAEARRDGGQLCRCLRELGALAEDPKERVRYWRRLAVAARDLAFDLELAALGFREVLKLEPDDLPVLGELTVLERRRSDMAGLAWALEQRARVAEANGDKNLAAAALRELGQVLDGRLGRAGEALVVLEKAARLVPDATALSELATLYLRLERPANARRALEDALALLPRHASPEKLAELRARLGRACELLGDKAAAREHYAQAFPLRRLDDDLAQRLEVLYAEGGHTRELSDLWGSRAQALLQAGRADDAAPLYLKAAKALLAAGDSAGAMLKLTAALDCAPSGADAAAVLEGMMTLEVERGSSSEAARLAARRGALATSGRDAARWFFKAATLSRETAREAGFLAQALEADGSFVPARLRHAEVSERTSPREAYEDLEVVLSADPKDEDAASSGLDRAALTRRAAFVALQTSNLEAARRLLAAHCAGHPEDVEAQLELVRLYRRAGAPEPLVDVLGVLWSRLQGDARAAARKEYVEGALSLGRTEAAATALRSLLLEDPTDTWAASRLLPLLPASDASAVERLDLLSRLIASAEGEPRAELLARRAELHRLDGRLEDARADLLDAAQASPRPLPLLRSLAELSRQSLDEGAELVAWRLVLERSGDDRSLLADAAQRLLALAKARLDARDVSSALAAWEAAITLPLSAEDRLEAFWGVAQAAQAAGNTERAEEALLVASRGGPAPRRVAALLERAALLETRGAREAAVDSLGAALALAPGHRDATERLKRALTELSDWEGLAEVLGSEAAHAPKSEAAALYSRLAEVYLAQLKQPGPAEAALRRVVALDSSAVAARLALARLLVERGEQREAAVVLETAAELSPPAEAAAVLREAAELAKSSLEVELELRFLRKANAAAPATGNHLERLGDALYLHGAVREALPIYARLADTQSFEENPDGAEQALLRLADLAEEVGDLPLAERSLRLVSRERLFNASAVERLATLVARRDPRSALDLLARQAEGLTPSPRRTARLVALARQASAAKLDPDVACRLYDAAATTADEPLPIRLEAAALLREANRTAALQRALPEIAHLHLTAGEVDEALAAWDEEARLAEGAGHIDEAVRTLTGMSEVCEDEGRSERAADLLLRLAELLRDSKLDLDAAAAALGKSWTLRASSAVARMAMELARRRGDVAAELTWLGRSLESLSATPDRAAAHVRLARLHLGLGDAGADLLATTAIAAEPAAAAETALQQALSLVPRHADAEPLLVGLYELQDRALDLAAYWESAASLERVPAPRAALLVRAAELYRTRAGRPHEAAAALLAARAALPEDLSLTEKVANLLHELGRAQDAADYDAILLEADPFHSAFTRHRQSLQGAGDEVTLASLLTRRAERQPGTTAAETWLEAAEAFRRAGAPERSQLCEAQAFDAAPAHREAFERLFAEARSDVRRQASLIEMRARALPTEAAALLRQRAELLTGAQESLLAAEAWDDYLALAPLDSRALEQRADLAFAGGGARAAQPFYRALVQRAGETLSRAQRLRAWSRLGQAALEAQAWRDAVDAYELVFDLDAGGEGGREALTHLSEAYVRLGDAGGQYRTALRLARTLSGAEAEALYRRAVACVDAPEKAIEALEALLVRQVADAELYAKAQQAFRAAGRIGDLVALHEHHAAAVGGPAAAAALLAAAHITEDELRDGQRAFELRLEATRLDPVGGSAAHGVLDELRRRRDHTTLATLLRALMERAQDETAAAGYQLELAEVLERAGQSVEASSLYEALRARGPKAAGAAQALAGLERLAAARGDELAVAALRVEACELLGEEARALVLLEAARVFLRAGQPERALSTSRMALAARSTRAGLELAVEVTRSLGEPRALAQALLEYAGALGGDEKARILLEASQAWASIDPEKARDALERAVREAPGAVSWRVAAERFAALGDAARALELGYQPALDAGELELALRLAEAGGDDARRTAVLWRMVERDAAAPAAARLAEQLRAASDADGLARLAALLERGNPSLAVELWTDLLFTEHRLEYLASLTAAGALDRVVEAALERRDGEVLLALLTPTSPLGVDARDSVLAMVAQLEPARRRHALYELATLREEHGRFDGAREALESLVSLEEDGRARAALHLKRGELLRGQRNFGRAKVAYEQALLDDPSLVAALRALIELSSGESERLVALVERLATLAGPEATAPYGPSLVEAYERLGRPRDAYRALAALAETTERVRHRLRLAEALGLTGEALALREKLAITSEELEAVLLGYLDAQLIPFAVRLGSKLVETSSLSPRAQRLLAERLSSTPQGASLASRLWPALLRERVADIDGWTIFGEALRKLGRAREAELADGFGAVLSDSAGASPTAQPTPVEGAEPRDLPEPPSDSSEVSTESMPRLAVALRQLLEGFGLGAHRLVLDMSGGVEVWLARDDTVVIGAGALGSYGPAELAFALALAQALGSQGHLLRLAGDLAALPTAAVRAFDAYPASLAAARVLAQLDSRVRGGDPLGVQPSTILGDNEAFRLIALRALERLAA